MGAALLAALCTSLLTPWRLKVLPCPLIGAQRTQQALEVSVSLSLASLVPLEAGAGERA